MNGSGITAINRSDDKKTTIGHKIETPESSTSSAVLSGST